MLTEFINNMTFTHLLLMALIVLVSILILSIRALMTTLFYEDFLVGSRGNILGKIYRELLNIGGAMNLVVSATEDSSRNICDVASEVSNIHDELNKLTKNIDAS